MKPVSRRGFLEASLFAGASSVIASRLAFANAPTDSRFVFVLLRGALDGLSAVPAVGDPDYAALRGQIALAKSGSDAALPLDGTFALHPALTFLRSSYIAKELTVLHAIASPHRERSHRPWSRRAARPRRAVATRSPSAGAASAAHFYGP